MTGRDLPGAKGGWAEAPELLVPARRFAIAIAMLLAILWQSFIIQTHVHGAPGGYAIADSAGAPTRLKAGEAPSELPAACPICQEVAHAGSYLLPAAVALQPPMVVHLSGAVTQMLAPTRRQRSHLWQSRAPPRQLQA